MKNEKEKELLRNQKNAKKEEANPNKTEERASSEQAVPSSENENEEAPSSWEDFEEITNGDFRKLLGCG